MLKPQADRLRHFLANAPTSMIEASECVLLALERVGEIATEYEGRLDDMPIQLQGELRLLDDLVGNAVRLADRLMATQLSHFCESLLVSALEAEAPWHRPASGSMARMAGETLH